MFRSQSAPGSRPGGLVLVLGLGGVLTLAACSGGSGAASPATTASQPTPTPLVTPASSPETSSTATVALGPSPTPGLSTTPATPITSGPAGAAGGPSRAKEIQAVTTWWVTLMKTRLHRTADPACVSGVVGRLSDADLGLMVAATKATPGAPLGLSAAGNALGSSLSRCVTTGTGLSDPGTSGVPAWSGPASVGQIPGPAGQCLLSTAEVSRLFDMDFEEPTNRIHIGTLGTANGCEFESTTSADHFVVVVLYAKINPTNVKSFESATTVTAKPIADLGDAAYFSGNALDIVIGSRMLSIEQEPFGDEDGLFAAAHLLLTRLR